MDSFLYDNGLRHERVKEIKYKVLSWFLENNIFILQMLVVFKSAPILKRALKIREENLQLYVLKVCSFPFIYVSAFSFD